LTRPGFVEYFAQTSNGVKKIIIFIIVIIVLGMGIFFIFKNSPKLIPQEAAPEKEAELSPSEKIPFDTNDNLDQAIEDLNQIE